MEPSRNMTGDPTVYSFHPSNHYPVPPPPAPAELEDNQEVAISFMKGPKRKRLAKACDACHKSKRRCDGTAPCSNCYYATKKCTYTDSSGRPVPAPRPLKVERSEESSSEDRQANLADDGRSLHPTSLPNYIQSGYNAIASSSQVALDSEDANVTPRKRLRSGHGKTAESTETSSDQFSSTNNDTEPPELDHALTRELTNLFFTHCHPYRFIIHKPSFAADLSHNRVPLYLLNSVCAMAAPVSKQPRIRTNPSRLAGMHFAEAAMLDMFDSSGHLICENNLATAQALCLLYTHDVIARQPGSAHYYDLALQIIEALGVHNPEHPTLTPVPSPQFIRESIERECVRRIFWLIHLTDIVRSIYIKQPIIFKELELRLRLPVDETSFELAVHSTLPEYLYLPAVKTKYASEFGHLLRILTIYAKIENVLAIFDAPQSDINPSSALIEAEQLLEAWTSTLAPHLRFSEDNFQVQLSMFETSSNTSAWCFCCLHIYHASCALALHIARQRSQRVPPPDTPHWAVSRIESILTAVGSRALYSLIMGASVYSLVKYCHRDEPQIRLWSDSWEELWGVSMRDLANGILRRDLAHSRSVHLHHVYHIQLETESRHSNSNAVVMSVPQPRPAGGDRAQSRSASPSAYPLGRSLNELRLHTRPDRDGKSLSGPNSTFPDPRRLVTEANIDPALKGGGTTPRSIGGGGGDGPLSLPSLKASGLLDSWTSPTPSAGHSVWVDSQIQQQQKQNVLLQQPTQSISLALSGSNNNDIDSPRTSGMPVGLQWLANETR